MQSFSKKITLKKIAKQLYDNLGITIVNEISLKHKIRNFLYAYPIIGWPIIKIYKIFRKVIPSLTHRKKRSANNT